MPDFLKRTRLIPLVCAIGIFAWGIWYWGSPSYVGTVGIRYDKAFAPVRQTDVPFHIWYPSQGGGRKVTVGGNGVFYGTFAGRNPRPERGKFPLIVMSHGAGGNAGQFGWIASELAEAGFVVALPNHPGTTSRNASAEAAVRVWERPKDVTAVIDHILRSPASYPFVDTDRIGVLGFSAGGYTALALSGARVAPDLLQRFCDYGDHGMSDCAFLKRGGVDLHRMDLSPAAQDLRDKRVKAAVVVDPGIVGTLTVPSLAAIEIPMLVLNLGAEPTIPAGVYARNAASHIPKAIYEIIPDAIHFSFLAQCKPKGAAILAQEGEPDLLCDDAGGRDRADIHAELVERIVRYFRTTPWDKTAPEPATPAE